MAASAIVYMFKAKTGISLSDLYDINLPSGSMINTIVRTSSEQMSKYTVSSGTKLIHVSSACCSIEETLLGLKQFKKKKNKTQKKKKKKKINNNNKKKKKKNCLRIRIMLMILVLSMS